MGPQLLTYPGHLITVGESDQLIVEAIQRRLNEPGCGPIPVTSRCDSKTRNAVKLYQTRFTDRNGMPLKISSAQSRGHRCFIQSPSSGCPTDRH